MIEPQQSICLHFIRGMCERQPVCWKAEQKIFHSEIFSLNILNLFIAFSAS